MPKIAVGVDLQEIERLIAQLTTEDRLTLLRRLEQKAWGERFRSTVKKIDQRRKKYPISQRQIMKLVKEARQERYAARRS